jgi:multisubunit Na+/H+ antiporter MnhE subunit
MSTFFFAILAGLAWMGLTQRISGVGFAVGATLGVAVWRLERRTAHRPFGLLRALRLSGLGFRLLVVFLWELGVANVQQLRIVLAPRLDIRPGWIHFRTHLETPAMRALFGTMLSLTPGSLTYEEAPGEKGGWVIGLHILDLRDEPRVVARIRTRFEEPLHTMENL